MGTLRPASPAIAPTADTAFQALVDTNASYILSPPSLISVRLAPSNAHSVFLDADTVPDVVARPRTGCEAS